MKCPHCGRNIPHAVNTKKIGSKGGKVRSPLKARSSDQARKAVLVRWAKYKAAQGQG